MNLAIMNDFVVWQCILRQRNFRKFSGKPSEGTIAKIYDKKSNNEIANFRSIIIEKEPLNSAKMFEFMIKKTHDPEERFLKAVKYLLLNISKIQKFLMVHFHLLYQVILKY